MHVYTLFLWECKLFTVELFSLVSDFCSKVSYYRLGFEIGVSLSKLATIKNCRIVFFNYRVRENGTPIHINMFEYNFGKTHLYDKNNI